MLLHVRRVDGTFAERAEEEWPLARTRWTRVYLDPAGRTLREDPTSGPASVEYSSRDDGGDVPWPAA